MRHGDHPVAERRPDRVAFLIAAALALVAAVIVWKTYGMGGPAGNGKVGPRTFPYVIAVVLFILSGWTVVAAWRGDFPEREAQNLPPVLWIVGGLAAQMVLLKVAGFSIATGLLFAATARGFGRGPLWFTVPLGIVVAFMLWIIFAKGLQLSLPAGPLENMVAQPIVEASQNIWHLASALFGSQ